MPAQQEKAVEATPKPKKYKVDKPGFVSFRVSRKEYGTITVYAKVDPTVHELFKKRAESQYGASSGLKKSQVDIEGRRYYYYYVDDYAASNPLCWVLWSQQASKPEGVTITFGRTDTPDQLQNYCNRLQEWIQNFYRDHMKPVDIRMTFRVTQLTALDDED